MRFLYNCCWHLTRLQSMLSFLRPRAGNCHSWKEARMSWSNARNEISGVKVHRSRVNHQEAMQKQKDMTSWSTLLLHPSSPPENGKHGSANWLKVGLKIKKSINFVMYKCIYMTLAQPQAYLAVLFWKQNQQQKKSKNSHNRSSFQESPLASLWLPMWVKILHF